MICWTSPQGERLSLRPCRAGDRVVIEVWDGRRLLTVADLESGDDIDVSIERVGIAVTREILEALGEWDGRLEKERAA